jgi:hypothetical protein
MNDRPSWHTTVFAAAVLGAIACALVPSEAHAVELYWDPSSNAWVQRPQRVVIGSPIRDPRRYYVSTPIVHTVQQPISTRVTVRVSQPPPPTPPAVIVDPGPRTEERDPYDTHGLVVAGAGVGGLLTFGDGITAVNAGYRLHLGLAIDQSEFALRSDLVPDAGQVESPLGGTTPAALYTVGASFNYRFLERAIVHPVAGIGLEGIVLDPHEGDTGLAFAATVRVALEFAYPISDGALALGIDATGHLPFAATEQYAGSPASMLGFGAYVDWRF